MAQILIELAVEAEEPRVDVDLRVRVMRRRIAVEKPVEALLV